MNLAVLEAYSAHVAKGDIFVSVSADGTSRRVFGGYHLTRFALVDAIGNNEERG